MFQKKSLVLEFRLVDVLYREYSKKVDRYNPFPVPIFQFLFLNNLLKHRTSTSPTSSFSKRVVKSVIYIYEISITGNNNNYNLLCHANAIIHTHRHPHSHTWYVHTLSRAKQTKTLLND